MQVQFVQVQLLTLILNEFDVAVVGLAQVAFEVITQVTASPFANADDE